MGFTILGNYALSLQIFTILVMFSSIAFKFLLPQDASGNSNQNLKKIIIAISIIISILGYTVLPKLIVIFFPKFIETIDAIGIMSLAVIPEAITMLCMSKMLGQEKTKIVLIARVLSLIIIITGFITIGSVFGIIGLAWIFVLAATVQAFVLGISVKIYDRKREL